MQFLKSKVGIWLSGALLLVSAQGCQGEEAPAPVATTEPRAGSQELINCGASLVPTILPPGRVH